jgi:hypothetical protein
MARLRFRLYEMLLGTAMLVIVDGLIHVSEGKPFMSEFLWGGAAAAFLLRGLDVARAYQRQWPEV